MPGSIRLKAIRRALDQLKKPEEELRAAHEEKVRARAADEEATGRPARGRKPRLNVKKL